MSAKPAARHADRRREARAGVAFVTPALILVGGGKMGSALLEGWLARGVERAQCPQRGARPGIRPGGRRVEPDELRGVADAPGGQFERERG